MLKAGMSSKYWSILSLFNFFVFFRGSALSTAVCKNVIDAGFHERVHIYVFDELVRNNYLSEVMNERHENIKYLPGIKLDHNLVS